MADRYDVRKILIDMKVGHGSNSVAMSVTNLLSEEMDRLGEMFTATTAFDILDNLQSWINHVKREMIRNSR